MLVRITTLHPNRLNPLKTSHQINWGYFSGADWKNSTLCWCELNQINKWHVVWCIIQLITYGIPDNDPNSLQLPPISFYLRGLDGKPGLGKCCQQFSFLHWGKPKRWQKITQSQHIKPNHKSTWIKIKIKRGNQIVGVNNKTKLQKNQIFEYIQITLHYNPGKIKAEQIS